MKMISEFTIENKDLNNNTTKQYIHVYDNGVVVITRFTILDSKNKSYLGFEKVKTMFGKSVFKHTSSYRLTTLRDIYINAASQLVRNGIELKDLA